MNVEELVLEKVRALPKGKLPRVLSFLKELESERAEEEECAERPRARPGAGAAARRWIDEHREAYAGQWVAMDADRLVAHGPDARGVYEEALRQGVEVPFLGFVKAEKEGPFLGGWL